MTLVAKGLKKTDVPSSGGSLATIAGTGGQKLPVQILDFTQDVTGTITIPAAYTYGYFKINMGSHSIDGNGSACFTNDNTFDVSISGTGTINSNADKSINITGSGATSDVGSQGLDITVANTSTSYYTSFSTTITQQNSPFNGNQSSGNWNVIRENAGSTTATWTATILDAAVSLSGSCNGKALSVTKNGTSVASLGNSGGSWGPISCVAGDVIVWSCSAGIGGGGTINRSQSWTWTGTGYTIAYSANTNGGSSGTFYAQEITLTNNNTKNLFVTLESGTTGISANTVVNNGSSQVLQGSGATQSGTAWTIDAIITDQTTQGTLYSAVAAFDGSNTTTDGDGVPSDGFDISGFTGTYNRVI